MESNDDPEGPDRRETSDTPRLTSGEVTRKLQVQHHSFREATVLNKTTK